MIPLNRVPLDFVAALALGLLCILLCTILPGELNFGLEATTMYGLKFTAQLLLTCAVFLTYLWIHQIGRGKFHIVRESDHADTFYFIGFIMTIMALIVGIWYSLNDGNINREAILGSFSIAMLSTLMGLIFRAIILSEIADVEQYQAELERTTTLFSDLDDVLRQLVANTISTNETFGTLDKEATTLGRSMDTTSAKVNELSTGIGESKENLSSLNSLLVTSSSEFEKLNQELGISSEKIGVFGSSIETANNLFPELNARLDTIVKGVASAIQPVRDFSDSATNFEKSLSGAGKALSIFSESAEDATNKISGHASGMESFDSTLGNLVKSLSEFNYLALEVEKNWNEAVGSITQGMTNAELAKVDLESIISSVAKDLETLSPSLNGFSKAISSVDISEITEGFGALHRSSELLSTQLKELSQINEEGSATGEATVSKISEHLRLIRENLTAIEKPMGELELSMDKIKSGTGAIEEAVRSSASSKPDIVRLVEAIESLNSSIAKQKPRGLFGRFFRR